MKMRFNQLFKRAFVLFMFVALSFGYAKSQTVDYNFKDGSLIFKLKDNYNFRGKINEDKSVELSDLTFMSNLLTKYGVTRVSRELDALNDPKLLRIFFVQFSDIQRINQFCDELKQISVIEYVEKDARRTASYVPNDPYYSSPLGIYINWHLQLIKAPAAWDIQQGVASVKVGVVDNAIWAEHPDLGISATNQCNASVSPATTGVGKSSPPTSVSQTATCTQTQLETENGCPSYDWSHGTHCAGLIGAKNNNGIGVASIGGGVTIVAARAADNDGSMWTTNITRGANFCVGLSVKVLSLSLGGTQSSPTEQTQFTTYYNNGITIVAAAGNEGDAGNAVNYPAGYNNVISVAAVDSDKKLSYFSQYGSWVDVACSGGNHTSNGMNLISTTYCSNQYLRVMGVTGVTGNYDGMQGTSMATPMVAGLCGLLLSKNPAATPAQIESCLKTTAQPLGSGSHTIASGSGVVNAQAALNCIGGGTTPYANFSANVTSGPAPLSVTFTDASTPGTGTITNRAWTFTGGSPASAGNVTSQVVTYNTAGSYPVTLVVTSAGGTDTETKTGYINVTASGTGFSLNFESCADFQTTFSPWTGIDVDGSATGGILNVTFPGNNTPMSFIAYNPASSTPATSGAEAHGGSRFGASFYANPAPNNDWLVSPRLLIGGSNWKLSLWVKSYSSEYLESYKVGVNTVGGSNTNFTTFLDGASAVVAPNAWTLREYSLSAYNGQNVYIGINCVSDDKFIFMVDDISIGAPASIEDQDYSSGVILSPNPATDVFFLNFSDDSFNNANIIISDLSGKVVKMLKYSETNSRGMAIETSDMSAGLYVVTIKSNDKVATKKVSITR